MCDISVVVANAGEAGDAQKCVDSVREACRGGGLAFEVLVASAARGASPSAPSEEGWGDDPHVRHLRCAPGSLVPQLWAAGIRTARGRMVALTIAEARVSAAWARRLIAAIDAGGPEIAGAGGAFALGATRSVGMRAMFYLRYHAFLAPKGGRVHHVAGDNAAYRRAALLQHADSWTDGFWEVELHRRLAASGQSLVLVPDAPVFVEGRLSLRSAMAQRYRHGMHSGRWRVQTGVRRGWQVAVAAPLVPAVLVIRIARGVLAARAGIGRFVFTLPAILVLASAWALGELRGALSGPNALALTEAAA